jgi:hypothetical protein
VGPGDVGDCVEGVVPLQQCGHQRIGLRLDRRLFLAQGSRGEPVCDDLAEAFVFRPVVGQDRATHQLVEVFAEEDTVAGEERLVVGQARTSS